MAIEYPKQLIARSRNPKTSATIDTSKGTHATFMAVTFQIEGVISAGESVYIEYIESNQRDWRTAKTLTITNPMYTSFGPVVVRVRKTNTANPVGVGVKYG